jgi:hypothetical protein
MEERDADTAGRANSEDTGSTDDMVDAADRADCRAKDSADMADRKEDHGSAAGGADRMDHGAAQ